MNDPRTLFNNSVFLKQGIMAFREFEYNIAKKGSKEKY